MVRRDAAAARVPAAWTNWETTTMAIPAVTQVALTASRFGSSCLPASLSLSMRRLAVPTTTMPGVRRDAAGGKWLGGGRWRERSREPATRGTGTVRRGRERRRCGRFERSVLSCARTDDCKREAYVVELVEQLAQEENACGVNAARW